MTENSTERHALRKTLLKNGYTPLPLASKGVFIKGWSRADVDSAWLLRWKRHAKYPNTGIRCDNVIAFDIDVMDEALADECEAIVEDECGPTELCRIGQWPKRLLLYRLDGEMGRSARTGKYGGHMVELLHGNGRQFAAFGKHPGTGQPYYWESDSPADIQLADLTSISADRALEVLDVLDDYLADTGLPQERRAYARGAHGAQAWDLMPDTIVDYEGTRIEWRDLRDQLTEEGGFGNLYRPEYEAFGDSSAVHFYLAHGTMEPCAHDFVHDCTHWESTYRPDFAALLPPPPAKKSANQFVHPDIADLEENCVILLDHRVTDQVSTRRLRVVNEHEVRLSQHPAEYLRIALVGLPVALEQVRGHVHRRSLQGVVEVLGALIEVRVARDDFPAHVHAELPLQGHHLLEDLGDAAALAGRVHVHDAGTLEMPGEQLEVSHDVLADHGAVGTDQAGHGARSPRCSRKIPASVPRSSVSVTK